MLNAFKVAFLFIGAMVGAGFATGREIALYFGEFSIWTIVLASVFIGVFCCFFLTLGKMEQPKNKLISSIDKGVNVVVVLSTIITFIAMTCGAEELFYNCFGIRFIGLISGLLCAVLGMFSMGFIKNANFVIVPAIIIMTIVLFVKSSAETPENLPLGFSNAINYTAMNMMLGGFLIKPQGKKMSIKQIAFSGIITSAIIMTMLLLMHKIVLENPFSDMPAFTFARGIGLEYVCGIIILLAILSTMLSSAKIIIDAIRPYVKTDWIGFSFVALLSIFCFRYDFKTVVDSTYPIVGIVGIAYLLYSVGMYILSPFIKKAEHKKPSKIAN